MSAILYALTAVVVASLVTHAWLRDPEAPANRAFLAMGWSLGVAWLTFALSLLPHLAAIGAVSMMGAIAAPAFAWRTIDALFARTSRPPLPPWWIAVAVALGAIAAAADAIGWWGRPTVSPPEVLGGLLTLGLWTNTLQRILKAREDAALPRQRTRLAWLAAVGSVGVVLGVVEFIARSIDPSVDASVPIPFLERGLTLQGVVPPISPVIGAIATYLLYHAVLRRRLAALQEVFAHLLVASFGAGVLLVAHTTTMQFIALTRYPLHAGFSLFLLSAAWLTLWEAIRPRILRYVLRWVHHPGPDLDHALLELQRTLPGARSTPGIARRLVEALHGSGRTAWVGVWLVDARVDGCALRAHQGEGRPPARVGLDPAWRSSLREVVDEDHPDAPARGLLDLLDADLILPLHTDDAVLGWIALSYSAYGDGFTEAERRRLHRSADAAARVLVNVEALARMAEEQRLATVGALSAGLAHEIRNPLAGLKGAAQVLRDAELDGLSAEMLEVVVGETDRLDSVVAAFLDYARPMHTAREPVAVGPLLQHVANVVRASGESEDVELTVDVPEAMPQVYADRDRLAQVLLNLVRNAVQAVRAAPSPAHRLGGHVRLAARHPDDETLQLRVEDDGPGISPAVRDRLFTPFVTTRSEGTGLGLAICQRIVSAHGGWIEALDRPGGGTVMAVELPVWSPHADVVDAQPVESTVMSSTVSDKSGPITPMPGT